MTELEAIQKEIPNQMKESFIKGGAFVAEAVLTKLLYIEVDLSMNKYKEATKRLHELINELSNVR